LALREERGLRMLENSVLKRIFGPKRNKITVGWRKLHNDGILQLFAKYNLNDQVEEDELEKRDSYMLLMGKPEGNRPLGRPRQM
jgi:hypothetical protein